MAPAHFEKVWKRALPQSNTQVVDNQTAVNARSVYLSDQPTATWYQIDVGPSDEAASFTSFVDTTTTPVPVPNDPKQTSGPNPWNVDHIFELQVIGEAFKADRP